MSQWPHSAKICVRVLASGGESSAYFDGKARGCDERTVAGIMLDDTTSADRWNADRPLGTGISQMSCSDSSTVDVVYYNQDNLTGTVIGQGQDSTGRNIKVWSGENVPKFLSKDGGYGPALPCVQGPVPIS